MRSMGAAARRMERDAERRRKLALKAEVATNAAADIEDWQSYLSDLVTIHTKQSEHMDWHKILAMPEPGPPVRNFANEEAARENLASFRPGLLTRLLGRSKKHQAELQNNFSLSPN